MNADAIEYLEDPLYAILRYCIRQAEAGTTPTRDGACRAAQGAGARSAMDVYNSVGLFVRFAKAISKTAKPDQDVNDQAAPVDEPDDDALTPQQAAFVEHYLGDGLWNQAQAAIAAGYSPRTARQQASRLMGKAKVREAIEADPRYADE